jgi:hypothetical protein
VNSRHLALIAVIALAVDPAAVPAQPRPSASGAVPVVKIAKWTLLVTAVGLGAYALRQSGDAADAYDALRALCLGTPARCDHGGRVYPDADAEALYDRALRADRQAQIGIYGGEAALLGSVALFILDLRAASNPPTIPYPVGGPAVARRLVLLTIEF